MKQTIYIKHFGFALFLLLGIASIVFYKERVLYVDSAYYAFNLFNNGYPCAEHNRYALYLYQLIPWALIEMKLSFPIILKVYSLNHILLHAIPFVILIRIKELRLALLLLIMQILTYRECFFLTVNETALAISSTLLLSGLFFYYEQKNCYLTKTYFLYFSCVLIAFFSHPMAMILIPFVIAFNFILNRKNINKKHLLKVIFVVFIAFGIKKILSQSSGYEDNLFSQLNRIPDIFSKLSSVYSFKFFFGELRLNSYLFNIYIIPLTLMLVFIGMHIRQKKPLELAFYLISNFAFWCLIIVFFNQGDGNIFMEKNFTPWVLTALYPLIYLVDFQNKFLFKLTFTVSISIVLFSIWGISKVKNMYTKRQDLMENIITVKNPSNHNKLLLQDSLINHEEWLGVWALPYETILLSKVLNIPTTTLKIYKNEEVINKELYRTDIFLGADFIPVLPSNYLLKYEGFSIPDQLYFIIKYPYN